MPRRTPSRWPLQAIFESHQSFRCKWDWIQSLGETFLSLDTFCRTFIEPFYGLFKKFSGEGSVPAGHSAWGFEKVLLFRFRLYWQGSRVDICFLVQTQRFKRLFQYAVFPSATWLSCWRRILGSIRLAKSCFILSSFSSVDTWAFEKVDFCFFQ